MPRHPDKPRRLAADERLYMWSTRHHHREDAEGRPADCRQTLTLSPQPSGTGGPLRLVFDSGPDRYVPGGAPFGSGDVGFVRGAGLNLHEPGAVRALLDAALADGWDPDRPGPTERDGWPLLEAAAAARAGSASGPPASPETGETDAEAAGNATAAEPVVRGHEATRAGGTLSAEQGDGADGT